MDFSSKWFTGHKVARLCTAVFFASVHQGDGNIHSKSVHSNESNCFFHNRSGVSLTWTKLALKFFVPSLYLLEIDLFVFKVFLRSKDVCGVVKSHLDLGGGRLVAKLCPTLVTPWTAAHQAPQSMEFPRQEYWRGLPFPSPGDLPDPGIEPWSPILQPDSLPTALGPGRPPRNSALPKVSSARVPGPRRQNLELPGVL